MVRPFLTVVASVVVVIATIELATVEPANGQGGYEQARKKLVREGIVGAGVKDKRVIQTMLETPRHEFVPFRLRSRAYLDMALPIGMQQTISSPFIVAYMTESLDPQPTDKVLEIGTGSGYQAAVLSNLVQEVYTIEIVPSLGNKAKRALKRLKFDNVFVKVGDGFQGWPEHAPFDKIIVTCSPEKVPVPLADQLREGGLMVVPVGERYQQTLYLLRKRNGKLQSEALRPTLFVPMTGRAEDGREVRPDPRRPRAVNGDFETPPDKKNGFLPGWYYQRNTNWKTDPTSPVGQHYIQFENDEPGLPAHLLQGFGIDGEHLGTLDLSAWVRTKQVAPGRDLHEQPAVAVSFYDENRKDLGTVWMGPFRGTTAWTKKTKSVEVPRDAREGILRIGLFGAIGSISYDDVRMKGIPRK